MIRIVEILRVPPPSGGISPLPIYRSKYFVSSPIERLNAEFCDPKDPALQTRLLRWNLLKALLLQFPEIGGNFLGLYVVEFQQKDHSEA